MNCNGHTPLTPQPPFSAAKVELKLNLMLGNWQSPICAQVTTHLSELLNPIGFYSRL